MSQLDGYQYVTPTVQSPDPRMRRAIDGWLGLYEACYIMAAEFKKGMKVAEDEAPYGIASASNPAPEHLISALIKGAEALNAWNGAWVLGGGLCMNFHQHFRATNDVDFFLLEDKDRLTPVLDQLTRKDLMAHTQEGPSFMPPDALFWWVPLQYGLPNAAPVNVDLLVAPHEFMAFLHSSGIESQIHNTRIRLLGAEALLILKLQAYRGKDQSDIQALLKANKNLNRALLNAWVRKFKLEARLHEMEKQAQAHGGKRFG